MINITFAPFSRKQAKVLSWWAETSPVKDYDGIIADGSIRSGKTLSMSLSFIVWAMCEFTGESFAMCGKTIGSFRRNVLTGLKQMLPGLGYAVNDSRLDNLVSVKWGERENKFYLFGGKDERSQDLIQGITLAGVFFDEVALMPESFVNQATGRCSVDGSKYWFNCNPDGPYHWFKTGWIDRANERNLIRLRFNMDDNLSLSDKVKQRYRSMYTGVFYQRYIMGLWRMAEGLVYDMFDESQHVSRKHPDDGLYYVSIDYGTQNPCSMGLWCVADGKAYRIKEYYYSGRDSHKQLTDEQYYDALVELIGGKPIQYIIVDPSAASFIQAIRTHGQYSVRKANNDVLDGIRVTASMLQAGKLVIDPSCENTIKEFGTYAWDEKATEDKVIKDHDHAMDDIRYFCYTVLKREFRWDSWAVT